jgi:hypothetical protein
MTTRTLYLLLALVVVSSIAAATLQGTDLQGAFKLSSVKTTVNTAILHVSSKGSGESKLYWDDETVSTLGSWKFKADENVSLSGLGFYIGPVAELSADNDIDNFFNTCSLSIQQSTGGAPSTVSSANCNTFFNSGIGLTGGNSYTFTLSGVSKSDTYSDFIDNSYDGKEVGMMLYGLSQSDGTNLTYSDSKMTALVDHEETGSTVEYTYGGTTLENMIWKTDSSNSSLDIDATSTGSILQDQQSYSTKSTTNSITTTPESSGTIASSASKKISVSIGDTSAITKDLTIKISTGGTTMVISNGSSTKTCSLSSTGSYSCDIP